MKVSIDTDGCIACGRCPTICPEVFRMSEDGYAEVYTDPVPESEQSAVLDAQDNCPVAVIMVG